MAKVTVYNWDKKKVGEVELAAAVFEQPVKKELLHTVVRWQLACRRQGNAMTKTKGLVSGGGKKPFKQKGTGNARQGSTRSPLVRSRAIIRTRFRKKSAKLVCVRHCRTYKLKAAFSSLKTWCPKEKQANSQSA
jgi:hypothetical protein